MHTTRKPIEAGDEALVRAPVCRAWPRPASARSGASLIGSAPDWSSLARFWARFEREAAGDLRAGGGVDAFRVLGVVDRRHRDQLAVEHDGEVLQRLFLADVRKLGFLAAVGDFLGDLFEDGLAVRGEAEGDVRLVPVLSSMPCCGLVMSLPVRTGLSLRTYQLFGLGFVTLPAAFSTGRACTTTVPGFTRTAFGTAPGRRPCSRCRGCVRFPRGRAGTFSCLVSSRYQLP